MDLDRTQPLRAAVGARALSAPHRRARRGIRRHAAGRRAAIAARRRRPPCTRRRDRRSRCHRSRAWRSATHRARDRDKRRTRRLHATGRQHCRSRAGRRHGRSARARPCPAHPAQRGPVRARRRAQLRPRARLREDPPQPRLHLRHPGHRPRQRPRPRRRHAGGAEPGHVLQPAVRLRRRRPGQDPPRARHRQRGVQAQPARGHPLCTRRGLLRRRGARLSAEELRRLQALLPLARHADHRRHPVLQ